MRINKLITSIALCLCMLPIIQNNTIQVQAKEEYDYYKLACEAYEVDTVTDQGTFELVGCYNSFNDAKIVMQQNGDDAVIRHPNSYSANYIIAMNRGYVYSYARRNQNKTTTLDIKQDVNSQFAKSTYIENYRQMIYLGTQSYNGDGTGKVSVNAYGFEGYVELKYVDFVPEKFVVKSLPIWLGGNDMSNEHEKAWQVIPNRTRYTVEQAGPYTDLVCYIASSWPIGSVNGAQAINIKLNVCPKADWMNVGDVYYSNNDTDYYSDPYFTQKKGTYYNYYQFVPLRSKSNISAEQYNNFLQFKLSQQGSSLAASALIDTGSIFLQDQEQYGMNAAMVFAQACLESNYGISYFATERNNLFGVNAVDSNPNLAADFKDVKHCIDNQMGLLLRQYTSIVSTLFFGGHFGNKGSGITVKYASNCYYGLSLSAMYYRFDKIASGNNSSLTDYGTNCIGVINTDKAPIYSSTDADQVLYTSEYGSTYQKNHTVNILYETGDYYCIQSTNYVSNGSSMNLTTGVYTDYNWDTMIGYIRKDQVNVVCGTVNSDPNATVKTIEMYRLYNPNSGEHFFTASTEERDFLDNIGWNYEGTAWYAPETSDAPVYRLYNANGGEHHYTLSTEERDSLVRIGWSYEGIGWYSQGETPLYRVYNPNAFANNHHYTTSVEERNHLISIGWKDEGIGWYGMNQ